MIEKETEGEQRKKGNPETQSKKNQERARTKQRLHREEYCFYHCFRPCRQRMTEPRGWGERNRTRENFGPSTRSTSFYHHRLRLERRILDREIGEEPQNRGRLEEEKNRLSFLCFFSRKQRRLKEKSYGQKRQSRGIQHRKKEKKRLNRERDREKKNQKGKLQRREGKKNGGTAEKEQPKNQSK